MLHQHVEFQNWFSVFGHLPHLASLFKLENQIALYQWSPGIKYKYQIKHELAIAL